MSEISWDKLSEKKRREMTNGIAKMAKKFAAIDYSKNAHTNLITKGKFYIVRSMQTGLGKDNPEYTDYKYWKANGWIDKARPWKAA
jgi:hypothetical protein